MIVADFPDAVARTETASSLTAVRSVWRDAAAIFALALLLRVITVFVLWVAAPQPLEALLGPDSQGYLERARRLAALDFQLTRHPVAMLGTYHAAPYYLFGAAIWLGAGLIELQVLNGVLGALAAALTYSAARIAGIRRAWGIGLLIALNPSCILLSSFGLLKDPSVMCASAAAVYGIVLGLSAPGSAKIAHRLGPWLLVSAALLYLRTSRFYVATFIEMGLIAAALVMIFGADRDDRVAVGLSAMLTVALGEAIPVLLGWPSSIALFAARVAPALEWQALRYDTAQGLAGTLIAATESSEVRKAEAFQVIDIVRRVFGPFVWVAPQQWDRMTVVFSGDYLLYPGTLLWYAMQPYVLAGIWASRQLKSLAMERLSLVVLSVFAAAYLLQFALVSLSYRQRDAMFPVFLLVAFAGYEESKRWTAWKYWYAVYWLGIAVLAVAHLAVRAMLRG